jgi:hypothetical protein
VETIQTITSMIDKSLLYNCRNKIVWFVTIFIFPENTRHVIFRVNIIFVVPYTQVNYYNVLPHLILSKIFRSNNGQAYILKLNVCVKY